MKQRIVCLVMILVAVLLGPATGQARYLNPNTGRFQTMDSYEGNSQDPASLHKYLYAHDNPVNMVDPSGRDGELSSLVSTMGNIGRIAGRTYGVINRAYWSGLSSLAPVAGKGLEALFWVDAIGISVGAVATVAPEVLNAAATLGEKINRAYSMNTLEIPKGWGARGFAIENIGGQQLEAMGGTYVGGNVKGIDGTIGVGPGNVLVSFKSHDRKRCAKPLLTKDEREEGAMAETADSDV